MKRGGEIIYSGELGQCSSKLIEYFEDLINIMGSMYLFMMVMGQSNHASIVPIIIIQRTIVYREKFVGMYSSKAYSLAQPALLLSTCHVSSAPSDASAVTHVPPFHQSSKGSFQILARDTPLNSFGFIEAPSKEE
ncbi:hypothetical protein Goari_018122, partial [Gossypium aridum]|nr:hypothetical protein [Gossypium aridum]